MFIFPPWNVSPRRENPSGLGNAAPPLSSTINICPIGVSALTSVLSVTRINMHLGSLHFPQASSEARTALSGKAHSPHDPNAFLSSGGHRVHGNIFPQSNSGFLSRLFAKSSRRVRLARMKMDVLMQSGVLGLLSSLCEFGSLGLRWPQIPCRCFFKVKGLVQVTSEKLLCFFRER